MKYTEATKILEEAGFKVRIHSTNVYEVNFVGEDLLLVIGVVKTNVLCLIDTNYLAFTNLSEMDRKLVLKTLNNLASTPIEERTEPKRYYIHRVPEMGEDGYLIECIEGTKVHANGNIRIGKVGISANDVHWKPSFTMEEVRKLEVKYDEDYSGMLEEAVAG
ncbi:hypothetical protein ACVPPR_07360 [Dellaglioa sp. L3N]